MLEIFASPEAWISLITLASLEIVLGIDNIVFIAILTSKLPEAQRPSARRIGIALALITRLLLLFSLAWIIGLVDPIFDVFGHAVSWRDIILIGGGLFLLAKGTFEIHESIEGDHADGDDKKVAKAFLGIVMQIAVLDIIFSLDSVITAVGMVDHISIMVIAILIAVAIMLIASGTVSAFIEQHPTVRMLAMSFLLLVGMTLVADGIGLHIPKGYLYFAMGFSVLVESLNLLVRRRKKRQAA